MLTREDVFLYHHIEAAFEIVQSSLNLKKIADIRNLIRNERPIVVAVHAQEMVSINEIPFAFAKMLSNYLDLQLNTNIVQAAKVSRTGADGFYRLANCPPFSGNFPAGQTAIIVDDTLTQGGTFASLKGHLEQQGGKVLLASALTGKNYSATLAISAETLTQLRKNMKTLKSGGLKSSVTVLTVSPNQKPATSSRVVRMLTASEIEFLRQDLKRANEILDRLLQSRVTE